MENAAKALITAAGVLIGVLIISITVYVFSLFGDFSHNIEVDREEQQIESFNSQFYKYQSLKKISAHDVISVMNLAHQTNVENEYTIADMMPANDAERYIQVVIDATNLAIPSGADKNHCEWWTEDVQQDFLMENMIKDNLSPGDDDSVLRFECTEVGIGAKTKYVNYIKFKKE